MRSDEAELIAINDSEDGRGGFNKTRVWKLTPAICNVGYVLIDYASGHNETIAVKCRADGGVAKDGWKKPIFTGWGDCIYDGSAIQYVIWNLRDKEAAR